MSSQLASTLMIDSAYYSFTLFCWKYRNQKPQHLDSCIGMPMFLRCRSRPHVSDGPSCWWL